MPKLIRLYITQVIVGFGLSAIFVGLLLWLNIANLWHLVSHAEAGFVAVLMLWVFNGIVFSGVQFGIHIMRMGRNDPPSGGKRQMSPGTVPVRVRAPSKQPSAKDRLLRRF